MGVTVVVRDLPRCDYCAVEGMDVVAEFDFATKPTGAWANGCERHYLMHRAHGTLGTGKGQLIVVDVPTSDGRSLEDELDQARRRVDELRRLA